MGSIRLLPEYIRNVIAAGEVIERPASVVKELIENSIDAGAENIRIDVLFGGKKLIKVSDDGCGMDREDALLSIQRFATSKISKIEDLFKLNTLGFRGEALASIASVSKLTIETGTDSSRPATFIEIRGGNTPEVRDAPPLKGTIITVRDLFFNTPARRKFLKANSTELNHIIEVLTFEALADFKRGYKLYADGSELLYLPQVYESRERIAQLFGRETLEHMIEFEHETDDLKIHGFISKPPEIRSRKTGQYTFINGRPVKDYLISKAVYDGLSDILPKDRHPLFVIYLSMPPSKVDFNVHPTKREVRFSDTGQVYEFVRESVLQTFKVEQRIEIGIPSSTPGDILSDTMQPSGSQISLSGETKVNSPLLLSPPTISELKLFEGYASYGEHTSFIPFGDVFVAVGDEKGLIIMDRHAAHERVLYERFLRGQIRTKRLIFPFQVELRPLYHRLLLQSGQLLKELGFEIEEFGSNNLLIRSIPEIYSDASIRALLEDIAETLKDFKEGIGSEPLYEQKRHLAATLACHKSIRAKDSITSMEIEALLRDLFNTSDPYHCPHGRPTIIKITIEELYKRFGRG